MVHALLFENFNKHIDCSETEYMEILPFFSEKSIEKKRRIQQINEPVHFLNFVLGGVIRAYCIDASGKEAVVMFALQDWWITDMFGFMNGQNSTVCIEALKPSQILQLSKNNFEDLLSTHPKFEHYFRILFQNAYSREQHRAIENLTLTAEERYRNFVKKYSQMVQVIPQKHIAAYLGMTPEFLSAIRKVKN